MTNPLKKMLDDLSAKATPGTWGGESPKRIRMPLRDGTVAEGPLMCYLAGGAHTAAGMTVSLGSERVADHEFVAALVNAWRCGDLQVTRQVIASPSNGVITPALIKDMLWAWGKPCDVTSPDCFKCMGWAMFLREGRVPDVSDVRQ